MRPAPSFLQSVYAKIAFATIMIFSGISSGIYVGNAFIDRPEPVAIANHNDVSEVTLDDEFVNFGPGDLFPLDSFFTSDGIPGTFDDILGNGSPAMLLFVDFECPPCLELLQFLKTIPSDRMTPGGKVIICLRRNSGDIPPEYAGLVDEYTTLFYDSDHWTDIYDMGFSPILIAVDGTGFVQYVQIGFADYIDYELVQYIFPN